MVRGANCLNHFYSGHPTPPACGGSSLPLATRTASTRDSRACPRVPRATPRASRACHDRRAPSRRANRRCSQAAGRRLGAVDVDVLVDQPAAKLQRRGAGKRCIPASPCARAAHWRQICCFRTGATLVQCRPAPATPERLLRRQSRQHESSGS